MRSHARQGALAGLIAGVLFGLMVQIFSVRTPAGSRVFLMELINQMSGMRSLVIGWAFHLFDCAVIGGIFGALMGPKIHGTKDGIKYGVACSMAWWILGGLFFMPIFLGLSVFSPQTLEPLEPVAVQSLIGHLLFGLLFGGVFAAIRTRTHAEVQDLRRDEPEQPRSKAG
jgi:xanthosine utilization system XapX-like protein